MTRAERGHLFYYVTCFVTRASGFFVVVDRNGSIVLSDHRGSGHLVGAFIFGLVPKIVVDDVLQYFYCR